MNNSNYYFIHNKANEDSTSFFIVKKEYWHQFHCLDDCEDYDGLSLPDDFLEICESEFETSYKLEDAIKVMQDSGFEYLENPEWI